MRLMPMWSKLESVAHTLPFDAAIVGDDSLLRQRSLRRRVLEHGRVKRATREGALRRE